MTDVHVPKVRSYNMSRIKGKDTRPEMTVRKYLHAKGLRYRLHSKNLPGKPDIYLPKYKTIIEIHGCFWHGHQDCRYFTLPKTKTEWWQDKISKTKVRDEQNKISLEKIGLKTIVIWECQLRGANKSDVLEGLYREIVDKKLYTI
ncbi:very short patch repair endonuclease [Flavobacterium sp. ZS1P14]|uniref:very short patch repair endonuclease n=1 Tax=Flavobacterium sp. ZS1P14 TaxID=3401729 RepID=UPI003AAE717C